MGNPMVGSSLAARCTFVRGSMIRRWLESLTSIEREAVWPVARIDEGRIDLARSSMARVDGLSRLRLCHVFDEHCPFELYVGDLRGPPWKDAVRVNFFLGAGADFATFEDASRPEDRAEIGDDVRRFLESHVRCVRERDESSAVIREEIAVERFVVDGVPITLSWTARGVPRRARRGRTEEVVYSSWVSRPTTAG
jgi:hypothetical protein